MAGGIVVLLGDKLHNQTFIGTGMHGGVIYIRGKVDKLQVAGQVDISEPKEEDIAVLDKKLESSWTTSGAGPEQGRNPQRRVHQAGAEIEEAICEDVPVELVIIYSSMFYLFGTCKVL